MLDVRRVGLGNPSTPSGQTPASEAPAARSDAGVHSAFISLNVD
jgi:hypothetical protein